jgi:hypothetical protein
MTRARRLIGYIKVSSWCVALAAFLRAVLLSSEDQLPIGWGMLFTLALLFAVPATLISWIMDFLEWRQMRSEPPA